MKQTWITRYRDRGGQEVTTIVKEGRSLLMVVRGVEFRGDDFDSFEPANVTDPKLSGFRLSNGILCSCVLEVDFPVPIRSSDGDINGLLTMTLDKGDPTWDGKIDRQELRLKLKLGEEMFVSRRKSGWFEDELLDIQKQLPSQEYMKACINCAFSDYSPYGHGLSGDLACFRDNKQAYLLVSSKNGLFAIWNTMTEFVQETYLCGEFRRRKPGAGYRG